MSDSNYVSCVGHWNMMDITDESGWAFEVLPKEDVVLAGFGTATRAESEIDLLPPSERELTEFSWSDLGFVTLIQEQFDVLHDNQELNTGKVASGMHDEEEEEEEGGDE